MKKIFLLCSFYFCISCEKSVLTDMEVNTNKSSSITNYKRTGITLDVARKFYDVETIKRFINTLSEMDAQFIHLHLSDNQNYALESELLGQTKTNATFSGGVWINKTTKRPFFSKEQIQEITRHAQSKGIEIIPEVDAPAHMGGIIELLKYKDASSINKFFKGGQLLYTSTESVNFIKNIYNEVINTFGAKNIKRFHIGMDEFAFGIEWSHEVYQYANDIQKWLTSNGRNITVQVWNDAILKKDLAAWDKKIEVCYWSFDGDKSIFSEREKNRRNRATAPEIAKAGFSVYNVNFDYLYAVPKNTPVQIKKDANWDGYVLLNNWNITLWNDNLRYDKENIDAQYEKQNRIMKASSSDFVGTSLAIWGEDSGSVNGELIRQNVDVHLRSAILKTKAEYNDNAKTLVKKYAASESATREISSLKLKK